VSAMLDTSKLVQQTRWTVSPVQQDIRLRKELTSAVSVPQVSIRRRLEAVFVRYAIRARSPRIMDQRAVLSALLVLTLR
jgi:hypothetical protein